MTKLKRSSHTCPVLRLYDMFMGNARSRYCGVTRGLPRFI